MKFTIGLCIALISSSVLAQAPWPMERQDRWGSGRAIMGPDPSTLTTPWISHVLAQGLGPVSHGAALGENGIGYFGNWVDGRLYKFDYNTGVIQDSFLCIDWTTSIPAIGSGNQVHVTTEGKFFTINTSNMEFDFFRNTGPNGGSPIIGPDGHVVYVTRNGVANRINPLTGFDVWSRTGFGSARGAVCFTRDDSKIVFSNSTSVTALNYADGTTAWNVSLGAVTSQPSAAPTGEILVGTESGFIYALDPANGSVKWAKQTLDKITGAVAFSPDGTVAYVPSFDWRVYAFKVSDGTKLWSFSTSHWCEFAPIVGFDGRIYVHNKFGDLYCISPDGSQIWQTRLSGDARGTMSIGPDATLYVGISGEGTRSLAIIRQKPWTLATDSVAIERGTLFSGGLPQLGESDDDRYRVQQAYDGNRGERPLRLIFTATSIYKPVNEVRVKLESSINAANVSQFVEVFNYSTGTWHEIDARIGSQTDETIELVVPNAASFCSSTGQVKLRVSWKSNSLAGANRMFGSIDQIQISVVPKLQI